MRAPFDDPTITVSDGLVGSLDPRAFELATVNEYWAPVTRPVISHCVDSVTQLAPPGWAVAVDVVTGIVLSGAVHHTLTLLIPVATAFTCAGGWGGPAAVNVQFLSLIHI